MEIYPGFAASEVLYKNGAVAGIATNDVGISKSGVRKDTYQQGMELKARATLFAEGCRGSLSEVGLAPWHRHPHSGMLHICLGNTSVFHEKLSSISRAITCIPVDMHLLPQQGGTAQPL